MVKKDVKVVEGVVTKAFPNASFEVKLEDENLVIGHLSGKMRRYRIKVMPGDKVRMEMTPYDQKRGRICYRLK